VTSIVFVKNGRILQFIISVCELIVDAQPMVFWLNWAIVMMIANTGHWSLVTGGSAIVLATLNLIAITKSLRDIGLLAEAAGKLP
jgi:hypothetical protein